MSFTEQVILVVLPIILPVLIGVVTYYTHAAIAKLPPNKQAFVSGIVNTAVTAAEQEYKGTVSGDTKRVAAVQQVTDTLAHYKMSVPPEIISSLIEESVYALKQSQTGAVIVNQQMPMTGNTTNQPSG